VPDLTTTVLTMTLTGIAADARRSPSGSLVRRTLSVAAMFGGAAAGALLVLHAEVVAALEADDDDQRPGPAQAEPSDTPGRPDLLSVWA
jgi:hypothetical protein